MMKRPLGSILTAAAFVLLAACADAAQGQAAKYCAGSVLVANSFYSTVTSNGKTADVTYYGQFQNVDSQRRAMTALPVRLLKIGSFPVLRAIDHFDLAPYQQMAVNLLSVHTTNPSGAGAPTPAQVGATLRFVCTFK